METLRDAGFKGIRAAVGDGNRIAVGTLATGEGVVVAHTPKGEGFTTYHNYYDALTAFDTIVAQAGLIRIGGSR